MNKIREQMPDEVEAFIPVLRETYRLIADYQFNRTEENETRLRLQLLRAAREMGKFKPLMQPRWRIYLDVLEEPGRFRVGDLICAFDCAVHQMHLRAGNKGLVEDGTGVGDGVLASPWSREMRDFLDERRRAKA